MRERWKAYKELVDREEQPTLERQEPQFTEENHMTRVNEEDTRSLLGPRYSSSSQSASLLRGCRAPVFLRRFRSHSPQRGSALSVVSRYPPASARANVARIVSASCRADSGVSSTATRAPGPSASFTKSMFSACSRGTWNGWSYDTLASRTSNHPVAPLPLPAIFVCRVIMVHIVGSLSCVADGLLRRRPKVLFEEGPHLLPAVDRLLLPIGWPVIVKELVAGFVIPVEFIGLAVLLQFLLMLIHLGWRRGLVLVAEEAQERA